MNSMEVFLAVADFRSFSKAADSLGITQPAISKHIDRLEKSMDVALLRRSTREITLTYAGELYYRRVKEIVGLIDSAEREVKRAVASNTGKIKISCTIPIAHTVLVDAIAAYKGEGNDINFKIKAETQFRDAIGLEYDLYIREGELRDSSAVARKAVDSEYAIYASPAYVEKHSLPDTLEELLSGHRFLSYWADNPDYWKSWLLNTDYPNVLGSSLTTNDDGTIVRACERGLGLAILPYYMAKHALASGRLVRLDYDYQFPTLPLYIIFQSRDRLGVQERKFIEFFVAYAQEHYRTPGQA